MSLLEKVDNLFLMCWYTVRNQDEIKFESRACKSNGTNITASTPAKTVANGNPYFYLCIITFKLPHTHIYIKFLQSSLARFGHPVIYVVQC